MRLIIGGKHQGKRAYAMSAYGLTETELVADVGALGGAKALYNAQNVVADCVRRGEDARALFERITAEHPALIIICDELGCGVVPMEPFDREWREQTGRVCCELAKRAESVERVLCGLPLRLK